MRDQYPRIVRVNRNAIISLGAGLLTLLSFCTAVAPIPLTGYVCYPGAVVLGMVALATGLTSLAQMRKSQEDGRSYALIGIWIGAIAVLASLCATTLGIVLLPKVVALIHQYIK